MAKAKPFDPADYRDSPKIVAAYLTKALESNDSALVAMAIGAVARTRGMQAVAEKTGLSRENLYRALGGDAKPEFATILKVLNALDISLVAQPQKKTRLRLRLPEATRDC